MYWTLHWSVSINQAIYSRLEIHKSQGALLSQNVNLQIAYYLICDQGLGKNLRSKMLLMTSLYLGMEKQTPLSNQVGRNQVSVW